MRMVVLHSLFKAVKTMSLDKAILHGNEKRKPYRGSKVIDCTCRNHGSCTWCRDNRLHKFRKVDKWQKQ